MRQPIADRKGCPRPPDGPRGNLARRLVQGFLHQTRARDADSRAAGQWRPTASAEWLWPGFALDQWVDRMVGETEVAHAPLIATLRGQPINATGSGRRGTLAQRTAA